MARVKDVLGFLDKKAPACIKMDFDNVGLLLGFPDKEVKKILVSLDITSEVIAEARESRAELIVSHHPIFFDIKKISYADITGRLIIDAISAGLSCICMHTNLDAAPGGVNDCLGEALDIKNARLILEEGRLETGEAYGIGKYGELEKEMNMDDFLLFVKEKLASNGLRYYDAGRPVKKVAFVSGSGGDALEKAHALGCDTLITADVKYHVFLNAKELDMNLIDADHFCTENVVVPRLCKTLAKAFPDIKISASKKHGQTARFC